MKPERIMLAVYAALGIAGALVVWRAVRGYSQVGEAIERVPTALRLALTAPVSVASGNAVRFPGGRVVEISDLQRDDANFRIAFRGETAIMTYRGQAYELERRGADGIFNATFVSMQ